MNAATNELVVEDYRVIGNVRLEEFMQRASSGKYSFEFSKVLDCSTLQYLIYKITSPNARSLSSASPQNSME